MGKHYGRLPHELLQLTVEEFRLAYLCWVEYERARSRAWDRLTEDFDG